MLCGFVNWFGEVILLLNHFCLKLDECGFVGDGSRFEKGMGKATKGDEGHG